MTHPAPSSMQERKKTTNTATNALGFVFLIVCLEAAFFSFLPTQYVSAYGSWVFWGSAAFAVLCFVWKWDSWKRHVSTRPLAMSMGKFVQRHYRNAPLAAFAVVLFISAAAYLLFVRFVPHLSVLAMGEPGSQQFVVEDVVGSRRCRRGVAFAGQPFVARRICGIPQDVRARLKPGMAVIVHGKKGWGGIIPDSIDVRAR